MFQQINSYELIELIDSKKINLIDIRDSYAYSCGTIKDAKNIPYNFLIIDHSKYLDKKDTYYIFCSSGSTSYKVCDQLSRLGYKVVNIIGGYKEYKDSII